METIWKFKAPIDDTIRIKMPVGAVVLSVQAQNGEPCIWAIVNPAVDVEFRTFHWRGTGHPLGEVGRFVGTVQFPGLVFHLFEARPWTHSS